MTVEQLTHFMAVTAHGNYARAAEALYLHPSTISKSIASLERELGGPVFMRVNGALALTDVGRMLSGDAPVIIERLKSLSDRAKRLMGGVSGSLSVISVKNSLSVITELYRIFRTSCPNVVWSAQECSPSVRTEVLDAVCAGTADFGVLPLGELPAELDEYETLRLDTTGFVLIVSQQHPLAERGSIKQSELAGQRILMTHALRPDALVHLSCLLQNKGLPPLQLEYIDAPPCTGATGEFLIMQVRAGFGMAIIPEVMARTEALGCAVLPIEDFGIEATPFHVNMVWRRDNLNPALLRFVDIARSLAK